MKAKYLLFFLWAALFLGACEEAEEPALFTNGEADFSSYVAVGNSLTAGVVNGDLYLSAQQNSFPALLAQQFKEYANGGEFTQPLMTNEVGFGNRMQIDAIVDGSPVISTFSGDPTPNMASVAANGPFNNIGVPGAKSYHLLAAGYGNPANGAGNYNPYFTRFASDPATSTVLDELPGSFTFFSLWIGSNDVLGYAYNGGENDEITPTADFEAAMTGILEILTASGAQGIIANIPDITALPLFNAVPYNALVLSAEDAAALNGAYDQVEAQLQQNGITYEYPFTFTEGPNGFLVQDATLPLPPPLNVRQLQEGEMIILTVPQDSLMNHGMGSFDLVNMVPYGIPDKYVLDAIETSEIETAIAAFNSTIFTMAESYDLALVDFYAFTQTLASTGYSEAGITFTNEFITGNAFSLDGVHPTQMGYAVIANLFIDAINEKYGAKIPGVWAADYPGI